MKQSFLLLICAAIGIHAAAAVGPSLCNSKRFQKAHLAKQNVTISNVTYYNSGAYIVPNSANAEASTRTNQLPFCEIVAYVTYGSNDTLNFNVWLPEPSKYQRRFMAVGNGGFAGTIDTTNMMEQLNADMGLAVAGGDGGHLASVNDAGNGSPGILLPFLHDSAQVRTWIHDGISLFTQPAKTIVQAYYHSKPKHSYYDGCSTGGAQGFALAQFHPQLFDGIISGSPGNWYSHLSLSFLWNALHTNTSATALPQKILQLITNATLTACDSIDGVNDGLIENPLLCKFDIDSLACSLNGTSTDACLTADQIAAAKAIYSGPVDSRNGSQVYPGFSFGSETGWGLQEGPLASLFSISLLQNLVFDDLNYNASSFNWASDIDAVDQRAGVITDEIDPNLSAFRKHGGKMLVTQGWADPFNAATWPIEHLQQVETYFKRNVSDFYELFMIPGAGHCGAAQAYPSVPAKYHTVQQMVQWVEKKQAPSYVLSTDPPDGSNRTRKLCPWPRTAHFVSGDINQAPSYVCA